MLGLIIIVSQTCDSVNESMGVSSEGVIHTLLQTYCCLLHGQTVLLLVYCYICNKLCLNQTCDCVNESMRVGSAGVNHTVSQTYDCVNESMRVGSAVQGLIIQYHKPVTV